MKKTERQLNNLPNIRMTEIERISMRRNLIAFMEIISPSTKIPSPFINFWSPVLLTMASFVFIIFGGSTIAYHASNSLPGEELYSWKVNVNEKVAGIFIKSESEKILYERNLVIKRIDEVKKLADEGALTAEKVAIAEKKIDTHIAKIDEEAKALAVTDPSELIKTVEKLQPIIDAHEKDALTTKKEDPIVEKAVEPTPLVENATEATTIEKLDPAEDKVEDTGTVLPTKVEEVKNTTDKDKEDAEKALNTLIQKVQNESNILQSISTKTIQ